MNKPILIITICLVTFVGVVAFVIAIRIDPNTIAALTGAAIGVAAAAPCAALITWLVLHRPTESPGLPGNNGAMPRTAQPPLVTPGYSYTVRQRTITDIEMRQWLEDGRHTELSGVGGIYGNR